MCTSLLLCGLQCSVRMLMSAEFSFNVGVIDFPLSFNVFVYF